MVHAPSSVMLSYFMVHSLNSKVACVLLKVVQDSLIILSGTLISHFETFLTLFCVERLLA